MTTVQFSEDSATTSSGNSPENGVFATRRASRVSRKSIVEHDVELSAHGEGEGSKRAVDVKVKQEFSGWVLLW